MGEAGRFRAVKSLITRRRAGLSGGCRGLEVFFGALIHSDIRAALTNMREYFINEISSNIRDNLSPKIRLRRSN